jgi:carboxypeptidase family protein
VLSHNRLFFCVLLIITFYLSTSSLLAQSPNTASMIVTAVDQNGAVVKDAKVSVLNNATGDTRESYSDSDGSVTIAGLSLTGSYTVTVSKDGFGSEERKDIMLRSGETATLKVTLLPGSQTAQVTVFGTTEGVRNNPQIGLPLQSTQIAETPILGRKVSNLPLLNSAFRQGKGTGDLFVNQVYFITGAGSVGSSDLNRNRSSWFNSGNCRHLKCILG